MCGMFFEHIEKQGRAPFFAGAVQNFCIVQRDSVHCCMRRPHRVCLFRACRRQTDMRICSVHAADRQTDRHACLFRACQARPYAREAHIHGLPTEQFYQHRGRGDGSDYGDLRNFWCALRVCFSLIAEMRILVMAAK
jgi:hypothetical protein